MKTMLAVVMDNGHFHTMQVPVDAFIGQTISEGIRVAAVDVSQEDIDILCGKETKTMDKKTSLNTVDFTGVIKGYALAGKATEQARKVLAQLYLDNSGLYAMKPSEIKSRISEIIGQSDKSGHKGWSLGYSGLARDIETISSWSYVATWCEMTKTIAFLTQSMRCPKKGQSPYWYEDSKVDIIAPTTPPVKSALATPPAKEPTKAMRTKKKKNTDKANTDKLPTSDAIAVPMNPVMTEEDIKAVKAVQSTSPSIPAKIETDEETLALRAKAQMHLDKITAKVMRSDKALLAKIVSALIDTGYAF